MTPESWSIQDVVEHLAIAEPQYWQQVQDSLKQPLGYKSESTDAAILWYGIDRTNRRRPAKRVCRTASTRCAKESLAEFRKLRATIDAVCEGDAGRSARPPAAGRQHGRLPVDADDLDALAAPHPADPRGQGTRRRTQRQVVVGTRNPQASREPKAERAAGRRMSPA